MNAAPTISHHAKTVAATAVYDLPAQVRAQSGSRLTADLRDMWEAAHDLPPSQAAVLWPRMRAVACEVLGRCGS